MGVSGKNKALYVLARLCACGFYLIAWFPCHRSFVSVVCWCSSRAKGANNLAKLEGLTR